MVKLHIIMEEISKSIILFPKAHNIVDTIALLACPAGNLRY